VSASRAVSVWVGQGAAIGGLIWLGLTGTIAAQGRDQPPPQAPAVPSQPGTPTVSITETVIVTTPMPGTELRAGSLAGPVQAATGAEITASGALDLSDFLNRRMNSVSLNEVQNNPLQPDLNYRGFTASPLLGTPQGLSVYMDGVRLNQPFGDVVSWDLIPRMALASVTLMPGSNPLFGLNTLGGALSLQTKDGRSHPSTTVQATYGNGMRRQFEMEHGGHTATNRLHWYAAGTLFDEDGWRDASPTDVGQGFAKAGWLHSRGQMAVSAAYATSALTGNGMQDARLLDRDYRSVYTKPDVTDNESTLLNLTAQQALRAGWSLSTQAYGRHIGTRTLNGDLNDESLDQSLYQPGAAERAALASAGYGLVPASGLDASITPFPSLRCVANVLLNDEPAEKCNGLLNRTRSTQRNGGASGQFVHRGGSGTQAHVSVVGAGFDRSLVSFAQSAELAFLNPDRSVTGVGAFGDGGLTGGQVDGEPYDARVDLNGHITTWSLFATDTRPVGSRVQVTAAGRYNRTTVRNRDAINPGGGATSLDGHHVFARVNPSAGVTLDLRPATLYASYGEGSRAATSIELGCANPEQPCKLPNAMAGDPPLDQVVTRTIDVGVRGTGFGLDWSAGLFRATNHDDILFVMSERTGFGYFRNVDATRRQGAEFGVRRHRARLDLGVGYTLLNATFESAEVVNGAGNSTNDEALGGRPGVDGDIEIEPGDHMPLMPRHQLKVYATVAVTSRVAIDANLVSSGRTFARGNENNAHAPDGTFYLGRGTSSGYAVVNLGARVTVTRGLQIVGQINNLLDARYATGAQLGPAGFTSAGVFASRPLPARDGEFPVPQTTFLAPGAPRRGWVGARLTF